MLSIGILDEYHAAVLVTFSFCLKIYFVHSTVNLFGLYIVSGQENRVSPSRQ